MKTKRENWISIKPSKKSKDIEIWAKGKEGVKLHKQFKQNAKRYTKILHPRICYTSEYDMFSMVWGDKPIEQTIETNLLHEGDLRFDITKNGTIVGLEIEDFSEVLKKFNCDKKENNKNSKEVTMDKIKILNEIENTDLLRVEVNHQIRVINKKDLEKVKNDEKI